MIFMNRSDEPQYLKENKKEWTGKYCETSKFRSDYYGKKEPLLEELKEITQNHCAFCDDILMPLSPAKGQIEHFKPKYKYKLLAYSWLNLFPICSFCNSAKGKQFNDLLLRPDATDFEFTDWFWLDNKTCEIKPNKRNSNWKRAEITIKIYGFNKPDKINRRFYICEGTDNKNTLETRPFRYMRMKIEIQHNKQIQT